MRSAVFYFVIIGYVTGILIQSLFSIPVYLSIFVLSMSMYFLAWTVYCGTSYSQKDVKYYSKTLVVAVSIIFCSFGMIRYCVVVNDHGSIELKKYTEHSVYLEGTIIEEADQREKEVQYIVAVDAVVSPDLDSKKIIKPTKILIHDQTHSFFNYGDRMQISGVLQKPDTIFEPVGRIFDYRQYIAKDKIFFEIKNPELHLISKHHGSRLKEYIIKIKEAWINRLQTIFSEPQASFALAMLISGKHILPVAIQNEFKNTGTQHIVIIAGYNVTLVAELVSGIFYFLPTLATFVITTCSIIIFSIMTGATAPVLRATFMVFIVLLSKILRRRYNSTRALCSSGFVLLIFNPMLLVFDPSFQISFLSLLALIFFTPVLEPLVSFIPNILNARKIFIATAAIQLGITPFLLYQSGQFSVVSLLANTVLFIFIPHTMLLCFTAVIISFFSYPVSLLISNVALLFLTTELAALHLFAIIPSAVVTLYYFPLWLMVLWYCCYAVFLYWFYAVKPKNLFHMQDKIFIK